MQHSLHRPDPGIHKDYIISMTVFILNKDKYVGLGSGRELQDTLREYYKLTYGSGLIQCENCMLQIC